MLEQDVRIVRDVRGAGVSELLSELSAEACGGEFDVFDGGFAHKVGSEKGFYIGYYAGKASQDAEKANITHRYYIQLIFVGRDVALPA